MTVVGVSPLPAEATVTTTTDLDEEVDMLIASVVGDSASGASENPHASAAREPVVVALAGARVPLETGRSGGTAARPCTSTWAGSWSLLHVD